MVCAQRSPARTYLGVIGGVGAPLCTGFVRGLCAPLNGVCAVQLWGFYGVCAPMILSQDHDYGSWTAIFDNFPLPNFAIYKKPLHRVFDRLFRQPLRSRQFR
jgi:hypothetical protein